MGIIFCHKFLIDKYLACDPFKLKEDKLNSKIV